MKPPRIGVQAAGDGLQLTGFGRPFGLAMDGDGRLLVADMDLHAVARLAADMATVCWLTRDAHGWSDPRLVCEGRQERSPARPASTLDGPHSVAVRPDGGLWIVTYYRPGLHLFDRAGRLVRRIGLLAGIPLAGSATARLDRAGRLWLTEYAYHSVLLCSPDGELLGGLGGGATGFGPKVGHPAGSAFGAFDRPHMATELADGSILVADTWNHRLQRFDAAGRFLGWLGGGVTGWQNEVRPVSAGQGAGWLHAPVAVGAAADGRFVVTDWGNNRLVWFDSRGRLLGASGEPDMDRPYDAQMLGGRLVIADSHNGRVLIVTGDDYR